jgi:hypothetical protein
MDPDELRGPFNFEMFFAFIGFLTVVIGLTWVWKRDKVKNHLKTCTHATTYTGQGRCPGCGLKATEKDLKHALVDLEHDR